MLPLERRNNRLLAIHMRIISFEYARYLLQVLASEGRNFLTSETEYTMLPKFELDRSNREFSKFLMNTSETSVKFILIKNYNNCNTPNTPGSPPISQEKIVEFGVDLSELVFICDDMSKARIKSYPLIVFEFIEGFYTTRDLYVNNTFNYELEPFSNISINNFKNFMTKSLNGFNTGSNSTFSNNSQIPDNANTNINNTPNSNTNTNTNINSTPKLSSRQDTLKISSSQANNKSFTANSAFFSYLNQNKKEFKFSLFDEKFKQYQFFVTQQKIVNGDKLEKIKQLNFKLQLTNEALSKFYKKYEMTINIDKMRKEIYALQEKIFNYEANIDSLKKLISQKQSDLHISSSIFCLNRENYKDKLQYIDKNYKKIEKYKIMYNSFKNKKLIEVAYFFFNKMCYKFYITPSFFNQAFDAASRNVRYQYYEKFSKELAVMMGTVANLINYLSKLFNIPLKYPLFINGSRSFIVKDKKEFVALYSISKNEDRNPKFDQAIIYLQENLNEILKYFQIRNEESDITQIGNENSYSVCYNYISSLTRRNLFSDFLKLSSFLVIKASRNKLYEDLI